MLEFLPAIATMVGQQMTNDANEDMLHDQQNFNSAQSQINRDWQTEMSNTSYQRAIKDMIKAGLNPMLAYSQGGASTPSGGAASSPAAIPKQNPVAAGVAGMAATAQLQNTNADTELKRAETELKKTQEITERGRPANVGADTERIRAQAELLIRQGDLTDWQARKVIEEIKNAQEENRRIRAHTGVLEADRVLKDLASYAAENEAAFQVKYRGYTQDVQPFIKDASQITNSASTLWRNFRRFR